MSEKSLEVQIIESIKSEDVSVLDDLFSRFPGQLSEYTFMGGQTWLGYAAQIGKFESVKFLVEKGSDVNQGDEDFNRGPICSAASSKNYEIVKYLLAKGASLDVTTSLTNPLFSAIVGGSLNIIELLLEHGVNSKVRYNSNTMREMDAVAFALMRGEVDSAGKIALWNASGDEGCAKKLLEEADKIAAMNAN